MLNNEISALINYAIDNKFLPIENKTLLLESSFNKKNKLFDQITDYKNNDYNLIWNKIKEYMSFNNFLDEDVFTDELASFLIGSPEYIEKTFLSFEDHLKAMDWYEDFSQFTTYIKVDRIKKNVVFKNEKYIVSFNKSKPEKTPQQIKEAALNPTKISVLSIEQVGKKGTASQSPRMAHRVITLPIAKGKWFIQYSPYQYFNKHSILISKIQKNMIINKDALKTMIDFLLFLPKFNISLNSDLPIVGGSILNHMHFQTGQFDFPIYNSKKKKITRNVYLLDWPITTMLVETSDKEILIEESNRIVNLWKNYSNSKEDNIFSKNNNSVSLTSRIYEGKFQMYIILRNNSINDEFPDGIFHVPKEYQIIKKENIGVIEASGFGIFPGRLNYNEIKDSANKEFIKWRNKMGGFNNTKEYYNKILKTFEGILKSCDPFEMKFLRDKFFNLIKSYEKETENE